MISKKGIIYLGIAIVALQSPLTTLASEDTQTPTIEEAFVQGFMEGFTNPDETLQDTLDELKPTSREQFYITKITKQLEIIINKAGTNEEKIQKAINVNVYLLDTLVANSKGLVEKAMAGENDPIIMAEVEKDIIKSHIKSKVKIVLGAIKQISKIYLSPEIKKYMSFTDSFADEPNQKDIDTIVQKLPNIVNMIDIAFETYAPTINELMKKYVGVSTKEFFHHARVFAFFGLQILLDSENKDLDPTNEFDAKDIATINTTIGYIKHSLENADTKTKDAYLLYDGIVKKGGTIKTYRESISGEFTPEFKQGVDMIIGISASFSTPIE